MLIRTSKVCAIQGLKERMVKREWGVGIGGDCGSSSLSFWGTEA